MDFPREVGFPYRAGIVYNITELLNKVNLCNGKSDVFIGLYSLGQVSQGKQNYDTVQVKHLYLDLDNVRSLENTRKLHDYLMSKNLCHRMFFSGGGEHIYIRCTYPNLLKNKRVAIYNAVMDIAQQLNLNVGIDEHSDIDSHTVGNIAQLVRVPHTYNPKRKRFCIPLLEQDLRLPLVEIQKLAEKQRFLGYADNPIYGSESLDLSPYDGSTKVRHEIIDEEIIEGEIDLDKINFDAFPSCIKILMSEKKLSHRQRFYLITYLKREGFSLKDTINILRKCLSPEIYIHCINEECQPLSIYSRADLSFPSCNKIIEEGLCLIPCKDMKK